MNSSANVIVNILVNSGGSAAGVASFNQQLNSIQNAAQRTATGAANSFNSTFGANFFANLASSMTQSMFSGFRSIVSEAVATASKFESAFAGVGSLGKNVGISESETIAAVKNLDLVKSGLLSVGDAATAMKNFLAAGFDLTKSIELIRRFGDAAAFGRQASFTFGGAIATASEGIKNQNSILVDNVGITKNLSVILKERGFQIQDLSDKVKGAAAREALYSGLIAESALQHGNATKVLNTYQGKMIQVESAQQRLLASLGDIVIKSSLVQSGLGSLVTVLDLVARNTGAATVLAVSLGTLATAAIFASTSFGALTVSQIANSAASIPLVGAIKSIAFALTNLSLVAALTAGELALLSGGVLAVVGILAVAVYAIYKYNSATQETVAITQAQVKGVSDQRDALNGQIEKLNAASASASGLSGENAALIDVYKSLNSESKNRVDVLSQEIGKTEALKEVVLALRNARNEELEVLGRTTTAQLIDKIKQIDAQDAAIKNQISRIAQLQAEANRYAALPANTLFIDDDRKGGTATAAERAAELAKSARDAENSITGMRTALEKARTEGTDLAATQAAIAKSLGITTDELTGQSVMFGTVQGTATDAKNAINFFTASQNAAIPAVNAQTDAIYDQIVALKGLEQQNNIVGAVAARRKIISDIQTEAAYNAKGDTAAAKKAFEDAKSQVRNINGQDVTVGQLVKEQQDFERVSKALEEKGSERRKRQKTETESLSDSVRKLRGEVESFQNVNSKAFSLRFEREELERVRRDFEKILDLRRELGSPLNAPLPTTAEGARTEGEQLERVKNLRDDVLKIYREIQEGDDKLISARLTATAAVVDAQTRADTAYLTGLRDRANAEQQLTADIATELRKRADIAADAARNEQEIEAGAYRDYLANESEKSRNLLRTIAEIKLLAGADLSGNKIISAGQAIASGAKPEQSPVLDRLDKSNLLLESILKAISGSGLSGASEFKNFVAPGEPIGQETITGAQTIVKGNRYIVPDSGGTSIFMPKLDNGVELVFVPSGTIAATKELKPIAPTEGTAPTAIQVEKVASSFTPSSVEAFGTGIPLESLSQGSLDALKAYDVALIEHNKLTNEERIGREKLSIITAVNITQKNELITSEGIINDLLAGGISKTQALNAAQIERNRTYAESLRVIAQTEDFLQRFKAFDPALLKGLEAAEQAERGRNLQGLGTEVNKLRNEAGRGGRDADRERLELEKEFYTVIGATGRLEADIERDRALRANDAYVNAKRRNDVLSEQANIESALADIEDRRATAPINQMLRERLAVERELQAIREDELKAGEDLAVAQVRIADKYVFHQERARANVAEHIAGMKGITEIYSDFKTQSIDAVWGGLDSLFDKLTKKIPFLGSIISQLLSNLAKLVLNPILMQLLGVSTGTGGGAAAPGASAPGTSAGRGTAGAASALGQIIQGVTTGGSALPPPSASATGISGASTQTGTPALRLQQAIQAFQIETGGGRTTTDGGGFALPDGAATAGVHDAVHNGGAAGGVIGKAGSTAATSIFSGAGLKSLGKSLGAMAPLLGLSLGAGLGGSSIGGQILGGIGGLAGGLAVGIGTGAIGGAGTAIGGAVAAVGGTLAATGILAGIAVPLIIGAWLLGRNKQRRADEITRTKYLSDAKAQMQDILKQVRSGRMDSATANAQAQAIRDNYMQQAGTLKDKKTRNIALATVRELDAMIEQIKVEGRRSDFAKAQDDAFVPTFDGGGIGAYVNSVASTSRSSFNDSYIARFNADTEAVLTRRDVAALGGYPALNRAGVRGAGLYSPSVVSQERAYQSRPDGASGASMPIQVVVVADEESADKLIANSSGRAIVRKVSPMISSGQDDGFVNLIESKMAGEI